MSSVWRTLFRMSVSPAGDAPLTASRLHAEVLLDETRQELDRADGKAAILLSAAGIVAGALIAGAMANDWHPGELDSAIAEWVAWVAIGIAGIGVLLLALAVKPNTKHTGDRKQLAYFGHVVQYCEDGDRKSRPGRLKSAKHQLARDLAEVGGDSMDRLADQLLVVSLIVQRKYLRIQRSFYAFGSAALLMAAALAVEAWRG